MAKKKAPTRAPAARAPDYTVASPNDPKVRKDLGLDKEEEVVEVETEAED